MAKAPTPALRRPPLPVDLPIPLTLPVSQVNVIMQGLGKLPLEHGIATFDAIRAATDAAVEGYWEADAARRAPAAPAKPAGKKAG